MRAVQGSLRRIQSFRLVKILGRLRLEVFRRGVVTAMAKSVGKRQEAAGMCT